MVPLEIITAELVRDLLPPRRPEGHKGDFGRIYVVAGAVGYTGAPVYAAEAAARTGSGLVFVGVPGEVYPIVAARCATAMAQPLPEDREELLARMSRCDAAVIGPGLGRSPQAQALTLFLLEQLPIPVILDADGINAAAAHIDVLRRRRWPTAATPHEGEFLRLGGDLSPGREQAALAAARDLGCVVVLKGPGTVVASPDGRTRRNTTGNCGMAKGGSGDVLAGMIASLAGQGADLFDAASCAVWLHGRAGDLCARRLTAYAMTPPDLVEGLPETFRELLKGESE